MAKEWINHHQFTGTIYGQVGDCLDCDAVAIHIIDDLITSGAGLLDVLEKTPHPPSVTKRMARLSTALEAAVCKGVSA